MSKGIDIDKSIPIVVSVIATVYNEERVISRLLDSLAAQTRRPDEVIICDGGSTDGTTEIIGAYTKSKIFNLKLVVAKDANISQGRNIAIDAATGPVIAVTDAGVRLADNWLENLVAPWEIVNSCLSVSTQVPLSGPLPNDVIAVAGFFEPDVDTLFQIAMAATVLPLVDEIDPDKFLPSSRSVAFTKAAWQEAGGYPEWLDYCEDLLFDFAINDQESDRLSAFAWSPNALVYFRPRENLTAFWRQYYQYARGDGKADLWRKRHYIRYITYLIVLPALLGHIGWGFFAQYLGWIGLGAGVIFYCLRPWQRLMQLGPEMSRSHLVGAALLVPLIRLVGDVAKMVGYPVGLWWRWRNRHRAEIYWRK